MIKHCLPALMMLVALTQGPPKVQPYEGAAEHKEPPKGWFCSTNAKDIHKRCPCKKMVHSTKEDPMCEDQPIVEDQQCYAFCWMNGHCFCDVECKTAGHQH